MRVPNQILQAAHIARLLGTDFEDFCSILIDYERQYRHDGASLEGPTRPYVGDQGSDLLLTVANPPRIGKSDFEGAITEDEIGSTVNLCKAAGGIQAVRTQLVDDCSKIIPLRVASEGGWVIGFVNLRLSTPERQDLVERMVEQLADHLSVDGGLLADRVKVIDANDLQRFHAYHPLNLRADTRAVLGIQSLQGLMMFEEWRQFLSAQRSWPVFASDDFRERSIAGVTEVLERDPARSGEAAVMWIYGPPGVGKTRLIAEVIDRNPNLGRRVLVAPELESGLRTIREFDVPTYGDVILVIDECPRREVHALAATFIARSQGATGTLVLIGPQDGQDATSGFRGLPIELAPLSPEATSVLIEHELGVAASDPMLVQRVMSLTEGYPWFAVLLSRALRVDPAILPEGSDQWEAAKIAIAGPVTDYGNNTVAWENEVLLRSKAMLAIVLTEGVDWQRLTTETREKLGVVFEETWSALLEAARRCWERGVVRMMQNWRYKYVTPNNLARLIAANLLQPPGDLARRIRESFPEWCAELFRRLEKIEVREEILRDIATEELRPFVSGATLNDLRGMPLTFAARHQPETAARFLRDVIERASVQELKQREDVRRDMVFALGHICRRKLGFFDAEPALFRLALAENETWANNATGVWSDLFLAWLSLTHIPFARRVSILRDRLADPSRSTEERLLLVSGLARAIANERVGPGFTDEDKVDGPWPKEPGSIIKEGKRTAWELAFSLSYDESLSNEVRRLITENLRNAVPWRIGSDVFPKVAEVVPGWTPDERASVREQVRHLRKYDSEALSSDEAAEAALEQLATAATPNDLHSKLLDIVGNWFPWDIKREDESHQETERRIDTPLAQEFMANPIDTIVAEFDWLDSEKAVRAVPFMYRVGELDTEWRILEPLEKRADTGVALNLVSAYLAGRSQAVGAASIDDVLRRWRDESALAAHTLLTIWRIGASDERVRWIIEDLANGRLDAEIVGCLTMASWGPGASPPALFDLAETLAVMPETTPRIVAVDILKGLQFSKELPTEEFEGLLTRLVDELAREQLAGLSDLTWEMGAKILLGRGRVAEVVRAATTSIAAAEHYGSDDHAWRVIEEAIEVDPTQVWAAFSKALEDQPSESYRIVFEAKRFRLAERLPPDAILEWIGDDQRRSLLAAELCGAHTSVLNPIARGLIIRFGSDSPAARALAAAAGSTPEAVSSLASFSEKQLSNATEWAKDSHPEVRRWAEQVAESQRRSYEYHAAEEEFEEREYH